MDCTPGLKGASYVGSIINNKGKPIIKKTLASHVDSKGKGPFIIPAVTRVEN